jgi:hypothetical protein
MTIDTEGKRTLLVPQPPEDLHGRVPLLGRGQVVVGQDPVDGRLERPQLGGVGFLPPRVGLGLGTRQGVPDLPPGMMELPGDGPDALAIAMWPYDKSQ